MFTLFYGRTQELATLEQWVVGDRCRLITILSMGGIGKTALAVKLAQQVQGKFEYVIWRSLRNAPPVQETLTNLLRFLSNQQETNAGWRSQPHRIPQEGCSVYSAVGTLTTNT